MHVVLYTQILHVFIKVTSLAQGQTYDLTKPVTESVLSSHQWDPSAFRMLNMLMAQMYLKMTHLELPTHLCQGQVS